MQSLYILYLDRHHLGDSLFLKSLAQRFAEGASGEPTCLLVHGSGEKVERTLEAQGVFPERTEGVLEVQNERQARLVERAVREMNQELVGTLTDEVVSAVGIQGVDRNLLIRAADGTVQATNVGWLSALLKQRVLPVVSAMVQSDSGPAEEIRGADAVVALAEELQSSFDPTACLLAKSESSGVMPWNGTKTEGRIEDVTEDLISDVSEAQYIHDHNVPLLITNLDGLVGTDEPKGLYVSPMAE